MMSETRAPQTPAELQNFFRYDTARRMMREYLPTPVITLHEAIAVDKYGTVTFGEWGGWLIQSMHMAFNDRLVLTPKHMTWCYDFGWCFPKGGAAILAALVWNPEIEGEPAGFIKRIGMIVREPNERIDGD